MKDILSPVSPPGCCTQTPTPTGIASPALDALVTPHPQLLAIALRGNGARPLTTPQATDSALSNASLPLVAMEAALSCDGCRAHPAAPVVVSTLLHRVWEAETASSGDANEEEDAGEAYCRLWEGLVEQGQDAWPPETRGRLKTALLDTLTMLRDGCAADDYDHTLVGIVSR